MDYKGLIDGLKGLINDKTAPEDAEKIGSLIAGAEQLESDNAKTATAYENMRQKYIESIKNGGVSTEEDDPIGKETKPKSFEDCVQEQIDKRTKWLNKGD